MSFFAFVILLLTLALGGVLSTITGGGLGLVIIIISSYFFDIRTNVALVSFLMVSVQVSKLLHFRTHVRWPIVGWYSLLGVPCSYLGGLLLYILPPRLPEIFVGCACLLFVVLHLSRRMPHVPTGRPILVAAGAFNGLIGGIVGNAAVLRGPIFISMGLSKEVFIGTSAATALFMNLGKMTAYAQNIEWSQELLILILISAPVLYLSVWCGKVLLSYVNTSTFEKLLLCVIFFGGISLLIP